MVNYGSAHTRKETPHSINQQSNPPVSRSLRKRALRIIHNKSLDWNTRSFIQYALSVNDPLTLSLVRRVESGEIFGDDFSPTKPA